MALADLKGACGRGSITTKNFPPNPLIAPSLFADHVNGKFVPLTPGANHNALSPAELLTQFKRRRLELAKAASWTFVRCSPSNQHRRQERPPPLGCMLAE
jgi:hypothetical protein